MELLPLAATPRTQPTDRDMPASVQRAFVRTHRTCVFATARRAERPSMSVVYRDATDEG